MRRCVVSKLPVKTRARRPPVYGAATAAAAAALVPVVVIALSPSASTATDGTNCELPWKAYIGGHPVPIGADNRPTGENLNQYQINRGDMVSNTGGSVDVGAGAFEGLTTDDVLDSLPPQLSAFGSGSLGLYQISLIA